jgi:signal transduction histidine kinase
MLIFGPWVVRLAGDLAAERRDRIRSEERSDMAAHLHDSVLQTLALIQRSDDPKKMVTLARSQERELRSWLYGTERPAGGTSLSAALEDAAGRVEQAHDVPVEVVVVNDVPVAQGGLAALVRAAAEAMNNAARHSGTNRVSVYAEAMNGTVDVYVSDQGGGFDPDSIPDDRHGVRESIIGRMSRHGGAATILSEPGEGTEVHLEMPMEVA